MATTRPVTGAGEPVQEGWRTRVTVVLLTYNCRGWVRPTLERLARLPVPVIVVDNGSTDGRRLWSGLELVELGHNLGAAGRDAGARRARTPYVAFCDDDEWYEPAGLARAVDLLDAHPRLALVNARILVGEEERLDPISEEMAASSLESSHAGLPGAPLLRFMAGAVVCRRAALEEVGGYDPRFFIGGEEETLALPLAKQGWLMRYVPSVVVHHRPSTIDAPRLRHYGVRNTIVTAWLHRPAGSALRWTWFIVRTTPSRRVLLRGLVMALACVPWLLRERRVVGAELEHGLRLLERRRMAATPGRGRSGDSVW